MDESDSNEECQLQATNDILFSQMEDEGKNKVQTIATTNLF